MANQCEFDMGRLTVRPISRRQGHDGNTVSGAATPQKHRPYRERTRISIVRVMREGRGGNSAPKAGTGREQTTVMLRPLPRCHGDGMCRKPRKPTRENALCPQRTRYELIMSSNVNSSCASGGVAHPISVKARNGGNAQCVVGLARSTREVEDSITFTEERGHTRNTAAHNSGATHSRKGRRS